MVTRKPRRKAAAADIASLKQLGDRLQETYELTAMVEKVKGRPRLVVAWPRLTSTRIVLGTGWFWWSWGEAIAPRHEPDLAATAIARRFYKALIVHASVGGSLYKP